MRPLTLAVADLQRLAELLLGERAEDHADDAGEDRQAVATHHEAERADGQQQEEVERVGVGRVGAEAGEEEDPGVEVRAGDPQQLRPERRERQVQHQQHGVADEEAGDQAPDQLGLVVEQLRTGLDAVALDGREHDRRGGRRRDAQGEHRHEATRGRGVVGRLRAGDALDRTVAELLGVLGEPLLGDVGEEGRDLRATGGDRAEREADRGAAQPRLPGAAPVARGSSAGCRRG